MTAEEYVFRCDLLPQYEAHSSEILSALTRVLESGRYTMAREVTDFEAEFSRYLDVSYVVGVSSGTDGIILALKALGVGAGDEVITTPFTAVPTVSAIVATGATPVFVDIDPTTYLMDLTKVTDVVTEKTRAVVPVHLFGSVVDVERLRQVLPDRITVVEDAAQAHGSTIRGSQAGGLSDGPGVFSFYPTKNLGGYGDGGAVVTPSDELSTRLRLLRQYGMTDKDHIVIHGVNSRLDELQAAILRVKLGHLDEMNSRRRELAERYYGEVEEGFLRYQRIPSDVTSNYHVFAARVDGDRDSLVRHLEDRRIQTNVYYQIPLHLQEATRNLGYRAGDFPICESVCQDIIALPMYPELSESFHVRVIEALNAFSGSCPN